MRNLFTAVMFDLDGTLLDTLADIAAAGNHMLTQLKLPPINTQRYRYLAGQGAPYLVQRAIGVEHEWMWDNGLAIFKEFQLQHAHEYTKPYPGIPELLDELTRRKVHLAVLSNKPDAATRQVVAEKLGRWKFESVVGHRDNVPLKPDPTSAIAVTQELAIEPQRWLYLGDTSVDMQTAAAAGMYAVGATWGFRDEAELRESGAQAIVAHPSEVVALLGD